MASKRGPKTPMTDEHKTALAQGRTEGKIVRDYLEALRSSKPKRGRKRTADTIKARLAKIDAEMIDAEPILELKLVQERMDLEAEIASLGETVDMTALEAAFVGVAGQYSERAGISYAAWRQVGIDPAVLARSGITRR